MHAEESVSRLALLDTNHLGLTPGMSYNRFGGTGYITWEAAVQGYFTKQDLTECRSGNVICQQVDPRSEIEKFFDEQVLSSTIDETSKILGRHWDSVNIGVAHHDLTFGIYVFYERNGIEYIEAP